MVSLPRTHSTVCDLLELMRCDSCSAALHQPFTTGICEHLLCSLCVPSRQNIKRSNCCPVCSIPVQPKDCQLHPQLASLVLIARRLKKLTVDTANSVQGYEASNVSDGFSLENLPSKFTDLVDLIKTNNTVRPNVTVKRAYSANSSKGDLNSKHSSHVTLKRGRPNTHNLETNDNNSINSQVVSETSVITCASQNNSIHYRPRLSRLGVDHQNKKTTNSRVKCLPAHTSSTNLHKTVSKSVCSVKSSQNHQSVNDLTLSSTSNLRFDGNRIISTLSPQTRNKANSDALMHMAPIASPEPSHLLDITNNNNLKSVNVQNASICLSPVQITKVKPPIPQSKQKRNFSFSAKSSSVKKSNASHTANSNDVNNVAVKKRVGDAGTQKFPGLLNFVHKFRPNSKGESVLHRAAIKDDIKLVEQLMTAKFSPDIRDHAGWTPLHEAAIRGHDKVAELLIKAGASVDIPGGPDLETPLHEAVQNGHLKFCKVLLAHGANPLYPNTNGLNALQLMDNLISRLSNSTTSKKSKPSSKTSGNKKNEPTAKIEIDNCQNIRDLLDEYVLQTSNNPTVDLSYQITDVNRTVSASTFIERRRLRPVLLATGLTRSQHSLFNRVANMIHARVVTSISSEVTHVVTGALQEIPLECINAKLHPDRPKPTEPKDTGTVCMPILQTKTDDAKNSSIANSTCPRTLKFLNAILQGCWILSFDWIETCAHVKMRVEEGGFEVTGCSTAPNSGAPCRARLSKEAGSSGLFHGLRVCFLGEFFYPVPTRDELSRLARSGDAIVLFSRERCSPIRLARLAIESLGPTYQFNWELDENFVTSDGESSPLSAVARSSEGLDKSISFIDSSHPNALIVFYDPGIYPTTEHTSNDDVHNSSPSTNIYALNIVRRANRLFKPLNRTTDSIIPLKPVPCTWLLNCAAEYRLLPLPDIF